MVLSVHPDFIGKLLFYFSASWCLSVGGTHEGNDLPMYVKWPRLLFFVNPSRCLQKEFSCIHHQNQNHKFPCVYFTFLFPQKLLYITRYLTKYSMAPETPEITKQYQKETEDSIILGEKVEENCIWIWKLLRLKFVFSGCFLFLISSAKTFCYSITGFSKSEVLLNCHYSKSLRNKSCSTKR